MERDPFAGIADPTRRKIIEVLKEKPVSMIDLAAKFPEISRPAVLAFDQNRELRWLGNLFVSGIFDGEHIFQLLKNEDGSTTFIHSEKFKGILVGLMVKKLDTEIRAGIEDMNRALKEQVEALPVEV